MLGVDTLEKHGSVFSEVKEPGVEAPLGMLIGERGVEGEDGVEYW